MFSVADHAVHRWQVLALAPYEYRSWWHRSTALPTSPPISGLRHLVPGAQELTERLCDLRHQARLCEKLDSRSSLSLILSLAIDWYLIAWHDLRAQLLGLCRDCFVISEHYRLGTCPFRWAALSQGSGGCPACDVYPGEIDRKLNALVELSFALVFIDECA